MNGRRWLAWLVALGLAGAAFRWLRQPAEPAAPDPAASAATVPETAREREAAALRARQKQLRDSAEAHLADNLNLPGGTIQADLSMVASMIAAYRSIYTGKGNPIGDNREIVSTLLGHNPNGIIFLQTGNRAINARGELCDRWGTPFFFHAESGTRMEIRSAGPDRTMWTEDDVAIVP